MRFGKCANMGTPSRSRSLRAQGVQFGTCPKICIVTFFTEFRVDAKYYITKSQEFKI